MTNWVLKKTVGDSSLSRKYLVRSGKVKELNLTTAIELLEDAWCGNPGAWKEHSYYVAEAARIIALHTKKMDSNKAYILGLIHDIGRKFGISHLKHAIDGYRYLSNLGYAYEAEICLTHSFPIKIVESYSGSLDCTKEEIDFLSDFLPKTTYNDYDLLIQLCDAIASKDGFCVLEERLIDVAIRNGVNEFSIEKWKRFKELKIYFDKLVGADIYYLLKIKEGDTCRRL